MDIAIPYVLPPRMVCINKTHGPNICVLSKLKKQLYPLLWALFREAPFPPTKAVIGVILEYAGVDNMPDFIKRVGSEDAAIDVLKTLKKLVRTYQSASSQ